MSSFNKFMEDLERRARIARERKESLQQSEESHAIRDRVKLYAERWQNSVKYTRGKK
tara:strand:- start:186 stop:356 length:171 start_codon:yes stop_codon:yes gene_type:complete